MAWRFRKRRQIAPGVDLNIGKRAGSISLGPRGARMNVGRKGARVTATLLGTGLAYVWQLGRRPKR